MKQCSHLSTALPAGAAVLCLVWTLAATPAAAQQSYRITSNGNFRRDPEPSGAMLAFVQSGTVLAAGRQEGAWLALTLEGWIFAQSVRADAREGHDLSVTRATENLRTAPNGRVVARVLQGALLDEVERRGGWVHVRRQGWMYGPSLERVQASSQAAATSAPAAPRDTAASTAVLAAPPSLDRATARDRTIVRRVPDGAPIGTLAEGAPVKILARSGDWIRIQTEGWVRQEDLQPAQPGVLVGVSAAELRSRPNEFTGKVLQWPLEFIAIQDSDEVRPEIPQGRPWVLARGPQPEQGYVYLIVSDQQLAQFRALVPLADVVVLGRVKVARSRYLQVPVLEVMEVRER